ncbi:hypothetical protein Clacol_008894 [Clathrus columnatus]|uniref:Hydrophobin n=1 Tax=Clathrus columnatus TaxID=1419009 RepID=A0AAV5AMB2_9AGAM|nr:hypothetical protein Clacol_008894 [Clathrus columnatus]
MFAKLVVLVATFGGLVSAWTTVTASPLLLLLPAFLSATLARHPAATVLVQVVLDDPNINVGLACAALNVGGSCTQAPVCCTDNDFRSVIAIGCNSISL